MATYLADSAGFKEVPVEWDGVIKRLDAFNRKWGFSIGSGVL